MGFTDNQKRAINDTGNIIVSAGAGSGKTTVMIERIINKLVNGGKRGETVGLEQMLIVTFTRASANDMRKKLTEKLYELRKNARYADVAAKALDALPSCSIGTLHSYCQKLVKQYFYVAGLDPAATVCDEQEAETMLKRTVSEAVVRALGSGNKYFLAMQDMLAGRNNDGLDRVVCDIARVALSLADPDEYLNAAQPDVEKFPELKAAIEKKRESVICEIEQLKKDLAAAKMAGQLDMALKLKDYMDGAIELGRVPSRIAKHDYTDDIYERFKTVKEKCKKLRTFIAEANEAMSLDGSPYVAALKAVAKDALRRYAERKELYGKIDYSDLEHGALGVLKDEAAMKEILRTIKYVFIDEFQDVNPLQSEIAEQFRKNNAEMFVVGDIKQSIYGFRGCSPDHFGKAIAGGHYTHIPLAHNFRSSKPVIDFVNMAFGGVMTETFGGVDYSSPEQQLVYGNRYRVGGAAMLLLADDVVENSRSVNTISSGKTEQKSGRSGYSVVLDARANTESDGEAKLIADCIADSIARDTAAYEACCGFSKRVRKFRESIRTGCRLLTHRRACDLPRTASAAHRFDKRSVGGLRFVLRCRKPKLGDIAVLMDSVKSTFAKELAAELDARRINYKLHKKCEASKTPEIIALVDILRCADNRFDDIALYTAMRSALGMFSDKELFEIARSGERRVEESKEQPMNDGKRKTYALWQKVVAYDGKLKSRVDEFTKKRDAISAFALTHDCADTLGYITSRVDYFQHIYETGGNAAAVDALISFVADRGFDAHDFLEYYDSTDFELEVNAGGDAVMISTIHASKGLEYGTVIVAHTGKRFNETDNYGRVLVSERGVFVKLPDEKSRTLKKTAAWILENDGYRDRERGENIRKLYVAMTRAKDRLIVTGKRSAAKQSEPRDASCFLRFLNKLAPVNHEFMQIVERRDEIEQSELSDDLIDAVSARHRKLAEYNASRSALPIKTCVTSIARQTAVDEPYAVFAPVLTKDDDGDRAMRRGTAYHRAMEMIDYENPDIEKLKAECEDFELVDEKDILVAANAVKALVANSAFVAKERNFIISLPAREVYDGAGDENVLVQGVIDLLIVDKNGNATIIDYKTGDPKNLENDGYRTQLKLYATAVELATPYKVTRTALYSFAAGKFADVSL